MSKRRIVVTGLGMVSPLGTTVADSWAAALAGKSGIGPITRFDATEFTTRIAGEVKGFEPTLYIEKKDVKKTDLFIQYGLGASQLALEDAGIDVGAEDTTRFGVIIGSGIGGLPLIEAMHDILRERGPIRVSPFFIPGLIANMAAGQVSIRYGLRGPSSCPTTSSSAPARPPADP